MSDICDSYESNLLLNSILLLLGFLFFLWGLSANTETNGFFALIAGILAASGPILTALVIDTYNEKIPRMNPQMLLSECKDKWANLKNAKSELERLEIVYKRAISESYEAFREFLEGWILSGAVLGIITFGSIRGWFVPSTIIQLSIVLLSITGTISFFLMIFAYLRYRDYSKHLFAIQLKKSDKAEISIKI